MGPLLRDITPRVQRMYDAFVKEHPWLADVTMSDDELREMISKDMGADYLDRWFHTPWNDHWDWVALDMFKYFYQTGTHKPIGNGYVDGNLEYEIMMILDARGVHGADMEAIVYGGQKYAGF